jgi:hypothetical protein
MSSTLAASKRPFETKDSIEMSYFGRLGSSQPPDLDDDGVQSPACRWIVKVTHRGILPDGVTEGTIWLFDAVAANSNLFDLDPALNDSTLIPLGLARLAAASRSNRAANRRLLLCSSAKACGVGHENAP